MQRIRKLLQQNHMAMRHQLDALREMMQIGEPFSNIEELPLPPPPTNWDENVLDKPPAQQDSQGKEHRSARRLSHSPSKKARLRQRGRRSRAKS